MPEPRLRLLCKVVKPLASRTVEDVSSTVHVVLRYLRRSARKKSRHIATVVSGVPLLFLKAKSLLLQLLPIHPTNTKNEHADVASEVASEVTEVIITEQQRGFLAG